MYLSEIRQQAIPTPVRLLPKVGTPAVIVFSLAAEDLHTIDTGAATEYHTTNNGNAAVVQSGLRDRTDVESEAWVDKPPETS